MPNTKNLRFPKEDIVKFIIKETLQSKKAQSQSDLLCLTREKLRKGDRKYTISGQRLRRLAAEMPEIKIKVHTRRGKTPSRCPSCSRNLKRIYSKNLFGKNILTGLKCSRCSYKGKESRWNPMRYEFEYVK